MATTEQIESTQIIEDPVVKVTSQKQRTHLANARAIKAAKHEAKLKQADIYANELKVVNNHLERLSSQFNTFSSALASIPQPTNWVQVSGKRAPDNDPDEEEAPPKKLKTESKTTVDQHVGNDWISMISQIIGASAAVGTLYLFKRYNSSDPDKAHVRRYENFTL